MDYKLAKEIYGTPWLMDITSMMKFSELLKDFRNGMQIFEPNEKDNSFRNISFENNEIELEKNINKNEEIETENISLLELNGVISKYDGQSHYGTVTIAENLLKQDKKNNIVGHIFMIDSGGGSANAVNYLTDAMLKCEKPIITLVDGMCASAAYYIASFSDFIIAHKSEDIIGSIGTMIEFSGYKKIDENKSTGERMIRVYADDAVMKNAGFENAIEKFDFSIIKERILNPANDRFILDVKSQRNNVTKEQLSGDTFFAGEVVGTLIDSIGDMDSAIEKIKELNIINTNSKIMTKQDLQISNPSLYAEILAEGIAQENDRVSAILAYADIDLKASQELIEKGEQPTQKFFAEMNRKALANQMNENAKNQIPEIEVDEENIETPTKENDKELSDFISEASKFAGINTVVTL